MENKLEILGFKNNPFYSKELKGNWLELFTNRDKAIERLLFYISSARTTAICSKQGIGKSSFLSYLNEIVLREKNILSRKFNFDFEKIEENEYIIFLRRLLLELLDLFETNAHNSPKLANIDYAYETARLHKTITLEENIKRSFGGKLGLKTDGNKIANLLSPVFLPGVSGQVKADKTKQTKLTTQINVLNNEEIKSKIIELGELYDDPIVFFIDELDKTGKLFEDNFEWAKQIYLLLRNCREIFESSNFIFVFALDAVFYDKKIEANTDKAEKNIDLFGIIEKFILLKPFSFLEFKDSLKKRLDFAELENMESIMDDTKLRLLYNFTRANSRKLMSWFEEVLFNASIAKDKTISFDHFFQVFEDELNLNFSNELKNFFIKLSQENFLPVEKFSNLPLDEFIDKGYIVRENTYFKFSYN